MRAAPVKKGATSSLNPTPPPHAKGAYYGSRKQLLAVTVDHSSQDPSFAQKPIYYSIFTEHIGS